MTVKENRISDNVELLVSGRLDTTTAPQLETKLKECTKGVVRELIIDLSEVEYISSAGLRVILVAHKMMAGLNGKMTVLHPSEFCMQVFSATGMDGILNIE